MIKCPLPGECAESTGSIQSNDSNLKNILEKKIILIMNYNFEKDLKGNE